MKASIRLVSVLAGVAGVALLLLSSGCAAGASGGLNARRPVRERPVLADEGTQHPVGSLAVTLEHRAERARVNPTWHVQAIR